MNINDDSEWSQTENMGTTRTTISYDDGLADDIDALREAGVVDSRSQFFQQAAESYFLLMSLSAEAAQVQAAVDDCDPETTAEIIKNIEHAQREMF